MIFVVLTIDYRVFPGRGGCYKGVGEIVKFATNTFRNKKTLRTWTFTMILQLVSALAVEL